VRVPHAPDGLAPGDLLCAAPASGSLHPPRDRARAPFQHSREGRHRMSSGPHAPTLTLATFSAGERASLWEQAFPVAAWRAVLGAGTVTVHVNSGSGSGSGS